MRFRKVFGSSHFLEGDVLNVDDISVIEFGFGCGFLRRNAGGDDFDVGSELLAEVPGDKGADGRNEEEEADGIGEETGGNEDGAGEEDHDAIKGFTSWEAAFAGGFLELLHRSNALGLCQSGAEDGGDDDDGEGGREAEFTTQGYEEVELGQRDEDEEDE